MPLRVAVIGVGASGLCTLRHLADDPDNFDPIAYDGQADVGGLWIYDADKKFKANGDPVDSALYPDLRVNLAKQALGYPDFDFPADLPSFPHNADVLRYLQSYADHFDLKRYIRFQTKVVQVRPGQSTDTDKQCWEVTTRNTQDGRQETTLVDAVMVCNGHESAPSIPDLPGLDRFRGRVEHSKWYRDAQEYRDKVVVLLGMTFSGSDMLYMLAPVVKQIHCCHDNPKPMGSKLPENAQEHPGIREVTPDGVILHNGRHVNCDVIMFCTGYHYSFPFLQEGCQISVKNDRIAPLYKHIFSINQPTLCFIGLLKRVLVWRAADAQARYACAVLKGDVKLPPKEYMRIDEENDYQRRIVDLGQKTKMTHDILGPTQWEYFNFIQEKTGFVSVTEAIRKLDDFHGYLWDDRFHDFRNINFRIIDDKDFEIINLEFFNNNPLKTTLTDKK